MPHTGAPLDRPIAIGEILTYGLSHKPDEPALVSHGASWTFRQLDVGSARLAANYLGLGLRPGDRVASLMPNRTILPVHYLACMRAGLVANPLNYRYTPPEIDHVLEATGASMLVVHGERDADIVASTVAGKLPAGVVWCAAKDDTGQSLEALVEQDPGSRDLPAIDPKSPGQIIYTSGSTGLPKGVTHSFETFGWLLASIIKGYVFSADDVLLPALSMSHGGGIHSTFAMLSAGGKVLIPRTTDADELLPLMREHKPTMMAALPAALFQLLGHEDIEQSDFASLRYMLSGGDKVPAELERKFKELAGFDIEEGYGATEAGLITFNHPGEMNKLGSVGTANPGFSLSIRDDEGNEVPHDRQGQFWIKSPTLMVGYWNAPDATAQSMKDGWFNTGDVLRADADGYFWFCGRKKQIIVHDGSNISPQEVEAALFEHSAVALAGVIGIRDLFHGENVRAYVTFNEGVAWPSDLELIKFARARVGYKAPEEIVILDEMPMIADGKVDRSGLKRMAEERHAGTQASSSV